MEIRVRGSKFKVQSSKFKVQSSKFKVQGSRFKVQGSRFKVQGSRFKVQDSRFKVQSAGCVHFSADMSDHALQTLAPKYGMIQRQNTESACFLNFFQGQRTESL